MRNRPWVQGVTSQTGVGTIYLVRKSACEAGAGQGVDGGPSGPSYVADPGILSFPTRLTSVLPFCRKPARSGPVSFPGSHKEAVRQESSLRALLCLVQSWHGQDRQGLGHGHVSGAGLSSRAPWAHSPASRPTVPGWGAVGRSGLPETDFSRGGTASPSD